MNVLTIVDTDILIDAARQISETVDCLAQIERQSVLAVSVITEGHHTEFPVRMIEYGVF